MTEVEVSYNEFQTEGKHWYVSDKVKTGVYIRDDLTEHSHMMNDGGTYFDTKEEAQAVCDAYNWKNGFMKIEEGKYYVTKGGRKVGPAEYLGDDADGICWNIPLEVDGEPHFYGYHNDGTLCIDIPSDNIVGELDTPEEDTEVESPRFKVGDKVVIVGKDKRLGAHGYEIGDIVTLKLRCEQYDKIGLTAWGTGDWYVNEDEIELATPMEDTEMDTQQIEVGLTYQCVDGHGVTCIYVEGDKAWMKRAGDNEAAPAYVWNKDTGEAISLGSGSGYDLKRSFVTV
jgi:hypothetical protein